MMKLRLLILSFGFLLAACAGEKPFDATSGSSAYSGSVVVTSTAVDPATGPGFVSWWDGNGSFKALLRDLYSGGEFATGSGFISPDKIILAIDGSDRLEILNLSNNTNTGVFNAGLAGAPLKHVAIDPVDGSIYVAEFASNTVEKFTAEGKRIGNPFIPATVGSCALASAWGLTVIPATQELVVVSTPSATGRFSKYTKDGACVTHVTGGIWAAGTPAAITYHAKSDKLIVAMGTTHTLYATDLNGGSGTSIFLNTAVVSTPRALASDAEGYLYVGSSGTDTVEKLYYSGTGSATRATTGPLLGPNQFTQNPTSITVIP